MTESFSMVIDGVPQEISGRVIAQIGDPARKIVFTFIKSGDGNYVKRKGKCGCCEEIQEDWFRFDSLRELQEYTGESWIFEAVFNSMCEPFKEIH